jgi:hypothetical protein
VRQCANESTITFVVMIQLSTFEWKTTTQEPIIL